VIVIDDEKPVLRLCQRMLERMGFDVHTANSGSEGLALYEKHQDEVLFVLLDLTMPGMDGRQTFEELAKIDPDVRVIVASGYASEEIMSGFSPEKAHPLGFMEKPYSLSLLEEWIAKARSVANGESSTSTR